MDYMSEKTKNVRLDRTQDSLYDNSRYKSLLNQSKMESPVDKDITSRKRLDQPGSYKSSYDEHHKMSTSNRTEHLMADSAFSEKYGTKYSELQKKLYIDEAPNERRKQQAKDEDMYRADLNKKFEQKRDTKMDDPRYERDLTRSSSKLKEDQFSRFDSSLKDREERNYLQNLSSSQYKGKNNDPYNDLDKILNSHQTKTDMLQAPSPRLKNETSGGKNNKDSSDYNRDYMNYSVYGKTTNSGTPRSASRSSGYDDKSQNDDQKNLTSKKYVEDAMLAADSRLKKDPKYVAKESSYSERYSGEEYRVGTSKSPLGGDRDVSRSNDHRMQYPDKYNKLYKDDPARMKQSQYGSKNNEQDYGKSYSSLAVDRDVLKKLEEDDDQLLSRMSLSSRGSKSVSWGKDSERVIHQEKHFSKERISDDRIQVSKAIPDKKIEKGYPEKGQKKFLLLADLSETKYKIGW